MAKQEKINSNRDIQLKLDKISKGEKFVAIGNKSVRTIDASTATLGELADYIVTLTKRLQDKGLL